MDAYLLNLQERKGAAWEAYKSLTELVAAESREFTPEEVETRKAIEVDLDTIAAEQLRHAERVALVNVEDSIAESIAPKLESRGSDPVSQFTTLREIVDEKRTSALFEYRALGDTPDGASAVPTEFSDIFVSYLRTLSPVLGVATIINTTDNKPLVIPRTTADQSVGSTVVAEGAGIVAADPTLSAVTLLSYKLGSMTFVSSELARSNVINLAQVIAKGAARAIGLRAGEWFTTGNGSGKPKGFISAGTNGGTASGTAVDQSTDTFFGPSDLVDLFMSPESGNRVAGVASWQVATDAMTKIRKIKDSNGNFLYNPLGNGIGTVSPGGFLLDRPLAENPAMAAPASATTSLAFGDFSQYLIRQLPLRLDTSAEFKFQNDQLSIRTIYESDGDLIDTTAIHYLVCAND